MIGNQVAEDWENNVTVAFHPNPNVGSHGPELDQITVKNTWRFAECAPRHWALGDVRGFCLSMHSIRSRGYTRLENTAQHSGKKENTNT